MRIESSVTAITWIPSEAIQGMPSMPFELGIAHYDDPPPDAIEDLDRLRAADSFREANELRAWIEVSDGRIEDYGHEGRGLIGVTRLKLGPGGMAFPAVEFPLIQPEPEVGDGWVRFVQTAGGRMGLPAPRRVRGKPYFQIASASAWTTLQLVIYADGQSRGSLIGASTFPRHWIYDDGGQLIEKSGTIDFEKWYRESFGENTPWGGEDTPALVTAVESKLERDLSASVMQGGGKMPRRRLEPGETLVEQGAADDDLFLLLDGVLDVEVDGKTIAQVGPGAMLGERAALVGTRTATLRAVTPCRIVVLTSDQISRYELAELALSHHREPL
jgi:hypothetical protein